MRDSIAPQVARLSPEEFAAIPVFPLPGVVFLPGTALPLHLFEPRYRELIEDCLARGPMALAVATLQPGWEADYEGRPRIHPIAGAGRITDHRRNHDGTHDIVVAGLHRVRLEELPAGASRYRRARAHPLDDAGLCDPRSSDFMALLSAASMIAGIVQRQHPDFSLELRAETPPGQTIDRIADRLIADPDARRAVLEAIDVGVRLALVTRVVTELLVQVGEPTATC